MRLFTDRELKLIGIGVAAATVLALAVSISVSLSKRPERVVETPVVTPSSGLEVSDLAIPDEYREITLSQWYVYRPRLERWNPEMIDRFWINPQMLELEQLKPENDRMIREIFEKVP